MDKDNLPEDVPEDLKKFLNHLEYEKRYSSHTLKAYVIDIYGFYIHYRQQMFSQDLRKVDSQIIKHWLMTLKTLGVSPISINRKLSSLRKFFKWMMITSRISQNPLAGLKNMKKPISLPEFVPEDKMVGLLEETSEFSKFDEEYRDNLILELFYDTGVRENELINIKCGDIDRKNLQMTIHGKGGKTRVIPISKKLLDKMMPLFSNLSDYLFRTSKGKQMYPKLVYRIVRRYLETTGTVKKNSPHTLRHSFATTLLNNGADLNAIKELLGHANLQATQIYTHTTYEQLSKIYKQAHPRA